MFCFYGHENAKQPKSRLKGKKSPIQKERAGGGEV